MNSKASRIVQLLLILSAVVILIFSLGLLIGVAFEPIDPFARAQRSLRCSNNSSVVIYERKTGWFTQETELSVHFIDPKGNVVRRDGYGTFPRWNDSEMKILENPSGFCDAMYWTRR